MVYGWLVVLTDMYSVCMHGLWWYRYPNYGEIFWMRDILHLRTLECELRVLDSGVIWLEYAIEWGWWDGIGCFTYPTLFYRALIAALRCTSYVCVYMHLFKQDGSGWVRMDQNTTLHLLFPSRQTITTTRSTPNTYVVELQIRTPYHTTREIRSLTELFSEDHSFIRSHR